MIGIEAYYWRFLMVMGPVLGPKLEVLGPNVEDPLARRALRAPAFCVSAVASFQLAEPPI